MFYLGSTKTQNPGVRTILYWRPPDVHFLATDPSLLLGCKLDN